MLISRIYDQLEKYLEPKKVLIIFGPRQVGKTTLLKNFLSKTTLKYKYETGDDLRVQNILKSRDKQLLLEYIEDYQLLVIDEAQKISFIGDSLKILIDERPDLNIIATGSSSFELSGQIGEPLTGRKNSLILFPIAQLELKNQFNKFELKEKLEEYLIFGSYPEIITLPEKSKKINRLEEITYSYLLKDILELERVKSSKLLLDLLRLIAFQVGNEVSLSELANQIGLDYKTVQRYLDLLEKSYILFNLRGFNKNLRKEITKKSKYFFYDNGIRNALIANFNDLNYRNDIGQLWENFLFIERLKKRNYQNIYANCYFWRTWNQKEIDIIEEREGKLFAFECKLQAKKISAPKEWLTEYPEASFEVISKENYLNFIAS